MMIMQEEIENSLIVDEAPPIKLSPKQQRFVQAMLRCNTVAEAAQQCKIGRATAYRWLDQPAIIQAIQDAQKRVLDDSINNLMANAKLATDTLIELCGPRNGGHVRLGASQFILQFLAEQSKNADLTEQLHELERYVNKAIKRGMRR